MSANTIDHLVKMANQIAAGVPVSSTEAKIESTAAHISKFWTPVMIKQIAEFIGRGGEGLTPVAVEAIGKIAE
ncbi:MAG: formate dehydrogenase [Cellvibrionales bacterium]|nr:MAG: formate dehydrogenase [Cellvibrionales bacterium]